MACADIDMDIQGAYEEPVQEDQKDPLICYYQASDVMPDDKGPLHELMKKQPAVLGSLQMVSGLLSIGVGVIFAFSQEMTESLFTLFRLSPLTGILFVSAGLISTQLFKYPKLLSVCLLVNWVCIGVAAVAAVFISIDLAYWSPEKEQHLKIEAMALAVLGLEVLLSLVLCIWFCKERRANSS